MDEKTEVRTLFLQQFMASLLAHINPRPIEKKIDDKMQQSIFADAEKKVVSEIQKIPLKPVARPVQNFRPMPRPMQNFETVGAPMKRMQFQMNPGVVHVDEVPVPKPQTETVQMGKNISLLSLNKIAYVLNDPSVISIECPGPDKPILVSQGGIVRTLAEKLSKEEIEAILKEASEKTKIPISTGVFTTALGDKILSAVISDFIGSRFIIQRKTPANNR